MPAARSRTHRNTSAVPWHTVHGAVLVRAHISRPSRARVGDQIGGRQAAHAGERQTPTSAASVRSRTEGTVPREAAEAGSESSLAAVAVMLQAASMERCRTCGRPTPHVVGRRGGLSCMFCRRRLRARARVAKGEKIGTRQPQPKGLARWGDRLHVADSLYSVALRAEAALGLLWSRVGHDAAVVHPAGCEMCGAWAGQPERLQNAHGWSRTSRAIMFHPHNTFALCYPCHRRHTPRNSDAVEAPVWRAWCERAVGTEAWLRVCAAKSASRRGQDLAAVVLDCRQRIAALPLGDVREWAQEREAAIMQRAT